ncbi:hypothetical protein H0H87_002417 [Tephrocybe sp. NHM501043]|nr:hypothetical protein H0H87_002417 [Tephrocybe sp. NHM501043]
MCGLGGRAVAGDTDVDGYLCLREKNGQVMLNWTLTFTAMSENKGSRRRPSLKPRSSSVPMTSNRLSNVDPDPTGLISPPPEETLQLQRASHDSATASKRKRAPPQPQQSTPNPKPRKQTKRPSAAASSPLPSNPKADFLPRPTTRRTTPIPAYEPPKDIFTPPRVVILTPSVPPSKRRSKKRASTAELFIKTEPPVIDLSAPMPPSSPTDDPLLLSSPARRPRVRDASVNTTPPQLSLPPSSAPSSPLDDAPFDWPHDSSTDMDLAPHPIFAQPVPPHPSWSSSPPPSPTHRLTRSVPHAHRTTSTRLAAQAPHPASDAAEGSGEYTGRFLSLSIRTKLDPPSSATKARMDNWGPPITPFPYRRLERLPEEEPSPRDIHDNDEREGTPTPAPPLPLIDPDTVQQEQDEEEERQVREMSLPLQDDAEEPTARLPPPTTPKGAFDFDVSFEEDASLHDEQPKDNDQEQELIRAPSTSPPHEPEQAPTTTTPMENPVDTQPHVEEHQEEEQQDQSMIIDPSYEEGQSYEEHEEPSVSYTQEEGEAGVMDAAPEPIIPGDQQHRENEQEEEEDDDDEEREVREMSFSLDGSDSEEGPEDRVEEPYTPAPVSPSTRPAQRVPLPSFTLPPQSPSAPAQQPQATVIEDEDVGGEVLGEADEDDGSDHESLEYGVVKITSADPRAAARAAAILKQHDYDCYTKLSLLSTQRKKKRHSLASSGVLKRKGASDPARERRKTLHAASVVVGDTVYIPGSPATTLPALLREAEAEVSFASASASANNSFSVPGSPSFSFTGPGMHTPLLPNQSRVSLVRSLFDRPEGSERGTTTTTERAWTKDEWKLLDACFTDERLALGAGSSSTAHAQDLEAMAPVDAVRIEDVVARFVGLVGGERTVRAYGEGWDVEHLHQRVRALQNKQRKGHVAPPTPRPSLAPLSPFPFPLPTTTTSSTPQSSSAMHVPDFTPLSRRPLRPVSARPAPALLPAPVGAGAPFSDLAPEGEGGEDEGGWRTGKRKLPASLLAPRYSHLLEEAIAVSQVGGGGRCEEEKEEKEVVVEEVGAYDPGNDEGEGEEVEGDGEEEEEETPAPPSAPSPSTLKTRMTSLLFSYLPSRSPAPSTSTSTSRALKRPAHTSKPTLPAPPPSKPRGPIHTPLRAPAPKPAHPKELVHLHPAPPAPKASLIPKARKPRRLVQLNHVEEEERKKEVAAVVVVVGRGRRSSGGSVKDLVKGFEEMREQSAKAPELKRVRSVGEWRKTAGLVNTGGAKPGWRP